VSQHAKFEIPSCLPDIVALGTQLWGEPTKRTPDKVLFGARGSKCVRPAPANTWFDHEANTGGGYLDLYRLNYGKLPDTPGFPVPSAMAGELGNPVAWWDYQAASGQTIARVVRFHPPGRAKTYRQCRPGGSTWRWKMQGLQIPLYHLPELLQAPDGSTICVTEGEKHADQIWAWGMLATTNAGGAKKFRPDHAAVLARFDCVILPDNDQAGREHAEVVASALRAAGCASIRVVNLPNLPNKGDIIDWVKGGGTAPVFAELVANASDFETTAPKPNPKPSPNPASLDGYDLTEDGIGLAFATAHQDLLRYDHSTGRWFQWTGKAWRQDETRLAFSWSRRTCRQLAKQAGAQDRLLATLAKAATAAAVERFAQSDPALAVTSAIWDRDPFLLGTPGGTLDLRTAELRDPVLEDYITKLTSVTPSVMPDCPLWLAFLDQVTKGDAGLIRFLKQWCGYSLTGDTREHALLFTHGPGGNGKGVFLNVVRSIMGDYAQNAAMDTFTVSQSDKHSTELAMLRGARLVTASETEEGRAWAEARIKALTGGDPITARFMRQDFFTFQPQFKLTIIGNHKPVLRNVDEASRRRINMAPFLYKPPAKDMELESKLLEEAPGILRWMIEGCLDWQKNGLTQPGVVVHATAEYFSEQDTVHQWVEDCCVIGATQSETLAVLFKNWSDYALANGEKPGTTKWFNQTLTRLGCEAVKNTPGNHGKRGFKGIGIRPVVTKYWAAD
jgi:putative DNA primase/helicase